MKIAIVHDWLTNLGGAERTVKSLSDAFPEADIYTSVYDEDGLDLFHGEKINTTWLQRIPGRLKFKHQLWVPLRPLAFRSLKLEDYDVIISSSSAEAKQVRGGEDTLHLCYCHTPVRYFWVNPDKYKKEPGLGPLNFLAPLVMPLFLRSLKRSDYKAAQKVNTFAANSKAVQARIQRFYSRDSKLVYPPTNLSRFSPGKAERKTYVTAGRQVAYKRHGMAVEACTQLGLPLLVLGNGPEHERLKRLAGPTITFNDNPSDTDIEQAFASAKAFIHPGEEDFGITSIEALASGAPVIAYKAGGALDYVDNGENGLFFANQKTGSLVLALKKFQGMNFDSKKVTKSAIKFSEQNFIKEIKKLVKENSKI